jgi:hypothetical protein
LQLRVEDLGVKNKNKTKVEIIIGMHLSTNYVHGFLLHLQLKDLATHFYCRKHPRRHLISMHILLRKEDENPVVREKSSKNNPRLFSFYFF